MPSCLRIIEDALRESISGLSSFQAWTGKANPNEALTRIWIDEVDPPANREYEKTEYESLLPLVIVEPDEDGDSIAYQHIADRSPNQYGTGWSLNLFFLRLVVADQQNTIQSDRLSFKDSVGIIIEELLKSQVTDIEQARPIGHPQITAKQDSPFGLLMWTWYWNVKNETQVT